MYVISVNRWMHTNILCIFIITVWTVYCTVLPSYTFFFLNFFFREYLNVFICNYTFRRNVGIDTIGLPIFNEITLRDVRRRFGKYGQAADVPTSFGNNLP